MAAPKVSNRMPRLGKANPGRKHIRGRDVTAKMQRQYEHILESLREHGRYRSERKRKQVAAATVWKLAHRNPGDDEQRASRLAEEFHGRPSGEVIEVIEEEAYDEYGAVLGFLQKLDILMDDDESFIPITFDFKRGSDGNIMVVGDPEGSNIEFVGGDQDIDWQAVDGASEAADKNLVLVGPVIQIDYFADKHHLSGPKEQKRGITYFHEFGEDGGELPYLAFDRRNRKLLFVGGSYTIEPEGITG